LFLKTNLPVPEYWIKVTAGVPLKETWGVQEGASENSEEPGGGAFLTIV
jgi:hypothetical protein